MDNNGVCYYDLPYEISGINYDIDFKLYNKNTDSVQSEFQYYCLVQNFHFEYQLLVNSKQIKIFNVAGLKTNDIIYLTIVFTPKKKTQAQFQTYLSSEGTGGPAMSYYSGSTWREFLQENSDWWFENNCIYCKWNHPWYGEMTLFNDSIDLDDFILDFTTYAFFTENICCFVAGTQILMADNTTKSIEDVIAGEEVFSYDINTDSQYVTTVVSKVINPKSISMAEVVLDNGAKLVMTDYHPLYTLDGWKSITNYLGYDTLQVGDIVKTIDGQSEIIGITQYQNLQPILTYTLDVATTEELLNGRDNNTHDNFYANGVVAHNADCPV